jgi:hypothetical protein|tara:strand:+ start:7295 stop:7468 length:174 start_codon:yes stop_codon:yes gene_type:complete
MDPVDKKTDQEIYLSIVAEAAKAKNELGCAQRDVTKANSRLEFLLVLANTLINRKKD